MSTEEDREKFIRSYLSEEELSKLISEAKKITEFARPTYSQFYVGACILTHEGEYITGCNMENISYTQSVHAEGCAISKAISENKSNYKAVAVYARSRNYASFTPPCGECRQFLNEYANFLPIIMIHETGCLMFEMLHEVLPLSVVLGADIPITNEPSSKYDRILFKANNWIMKDIYSVTRNQMRKLLRDWRFDEIDKLTEGCLKFNDQGVVEERFYAGTVNINFFTVQRLFEGLALALGSKEKLIINYHHDNISESIAHRILATLITYKFDVQLSLDDKYLHEKAAQDFYIVDISKPKEKEEHYRIHLIRGDKQGIEKVLMDKIHRNRDELLVSKFLNELYDYNSNKLIDNTKYVL